MKSNIKTSKRVPFAFSIALLLASSWVMPSAFADDQFRTETVKFHDLNLDSPSGIVALYGRIHSAAQRVCSESDPVWQVAASACAKKAEAKAITDLGLSQLTAYYEIKTGNSMRTVSASR